MKYTLFCVPGRMCSPSTHYVILGKWLPYDPSIVILVHGIMSYTEVERVKRDSLIPVFSSPSNAWIGLYASYRSRRHPDCLLIGLLHRIKGNLYGGMIHE